MPNSFFCATVIILNIMPGPSMLFVAQQTLQRGFRAGVFAMTGIALGTSLHILASFLGITMLLAHSHVVLFVIQILSALFLIYLGFSQLLQKNRLLIEEKKAALQASNTLVKGMFINLLNPKIIIFFMAFLPQFINPTSDLANLEIVLYGSIFGLVGGIVNLTLSFLINYFSQRYLQKNKESLLVTRIIQGMSTTLILFGLSIIFFKFR